VFRSVRCRAGRVGLRSVVFSSLRGYRRSRVPAHVLAGATSLVIAVRASGDVPAGGDASDHWSLCVRRGHCAVRVAGVQSADVGGRRFHDRPAVYRRACPPGFDRFSAVHGPCRILAVAVGVLVTLVASTVLVAALGLHGDDVAVLGTLVHGAPPFGLGGCPGQRSPAWRRSPASWPWWW
jgi:hypothetical protein